MAHADMDTSVENFEQLTALWGSAGDHDLKASLVDPCGPGGGNPVVRYEGETDDLLNFLMSHYHDGASTREDMRRLHVREKQTKASHLQRAIDLAADQNVSFEAQRLIEEYVAREHPSAIKLKYLVIALLDLCY